MINRENYQEVQKYLDYQSSVKQCDERTIASIDSSLRHFLEWADGARFTAAHKIKPTYPAYLANLKRPDGKQLVNSAWFSACCKNAQAFLMWARAEFIKPYKDIEQNWVKSIRPPRSRTEQSEIKKRDIYELDEVIKLSTFPVTALKYKRMQAAAAFLFLSGMRIGAFVTLPASCVDLDTLRAQQLPAMGVATKNHKAAITSLLNIPELLEVARAWDERVRREGGNDPLWYAHFNAYGVIATNRPSDEAMKKRTGNFRDDLQELCQLAGVAYKSPHKFRHGHAVYSLKRAKNVEGLKAISQNLMHSTIGITDGIYGNLVEDDVHSVIVGLAGKSITADAKPSNDLEAMLRQLLQQVEQNKQKAIEAG